MNLNSTFSVFCYMLLFSLSISVSAQEVIGTQGSSSSNSDCILDYTIGEVIIAFGQDTDNHLTQGFHQPKLSITMVEEFTNELDINVFPNPVNEFINIHIDNYIQGCTIQLYDLLGKELMSVSILDNRISIPFHGYSTGSYLLVICSKDKQKLITYKVLKTQ